MPSALPAEFSSVLAHRSEPLIGTMSAAGAALLLLGEAGSGKSYLARHVASTVASASDGRVHAVTLPSPRGVSCGPAELFGSVAPETFRALPAGAPHPFDAAEFSGRLLAELRGRAAGADLLLVLPGVDRYSPDAVAVLEHLLRERGIRLLATAARQVGGASCLGRDPRVTRSAVAPLEPREADALLSSLLGVSHIAPETLNRWHVATAGNSYALIMLLIANERAGTVRRRNGLAWVPPGLDEIPEEFTSLLDESCSDAERETLEMVALAEPMIEAPLLRLLDPEATNALLERNLLVSRHHPSGQRALMVGRPILAMAIRDRIPPPRRIRLSDAFFAALTAEPGGSGVAQGPRHLVSRVVFGIEGGRPIPHDWLVSAFDALSIDGDPRLLLRVSLALARGYASAEAAAAAVRASALATLFGDGYAAELALSAIDGLLADERAAERIPAMLRTRMALVRIEHRFRLGESMEGILDQLDRLETGLEPEQAVAREAVRCARFRLRVEHGDLAAGFRERVDDAPSDDVIVEWVRASARSTCALILQQRGQLDLATRMAERARGLSLIGRPPLNDELELQNFCWFLGYWAGGDGEAARQVLDEIEAQARAGARPETYRLGVTEVARSLLAVQEGRWRDAVDLVEVLLESFDAQDPYGVAPLLHAVQALALAALGDHDGATGALRFAGEERRGIGRAAGGFTRRIALQARQWLRVGDPGAQALELAAWAREQQLGLIELEALYLAACESRELATQVRARAGELGADVDPLVGEVIVAHIGKIADGASATDVSEPEVRLLADLGLWAPLPVDVGLSAREREVALFAALGYSSRFIADRLYLSARTVESHLSHVYTKLGVADRDALRHWFSADRAVEERGFAA